MSSSDQGKIWEEINGIRTILGYKADLQESYKDELKALHLFIGVEPPISLSSNSDLIDVSDELRLLKVVVGVV